MTHEKFVRKAYANSNKKQRKERGFRVFNMVIFIWMLLSDIERSIK